MVWWPEAPSTRFLRPMAAASFFFDAADEELVVVVVVVVDDAAGAVGDVSGELARSDEV